MGNSTIYTQFEFQISIVMTAELSRMFCILAVYIYSV